MKTASKRRRRPAAPTRRRSARSRPTRERILDAAERLFAQRGFHGVSIRDITGAADVDVALANYHFGSKQGLLEAVFLRRAEDLNSERLARLDAAIAGARGQPPQLEEIIDAFTHPLLDRSARGSAGWKSYFALIARDQQLGRVRRRADDEDVRPGRAAVHRGDAPRAARLRRARPVLGIPLPVGRADADVRGDRAHRQAVGRNLQGERPRQRPRAAGAVLRGGFPCAVRAQRAACEAARHERKAKR